ncbi:MAG: T9SS type A sorting domain-containing protein [Bacteroidetes bacterium]|nr:T9SS type A sorting domain-containing protein [Bacteroidota bacterium]
MALATCSVCAANDFWEWNQSTNVWTQKANFGGVPRIWAVGFSIGLKGYIGTGGTYYQDFLEYEPTLDAWTQKPNYGGGERYFGVGFSIGNIGYVGTGADNLQIPRKDFWSFDPSANGVTELENKISVSVYPNPSNGKFTIETLENKSFIVRITNPLGQKVAEKKFQKRIEVDVSGFGKGLFLVEVSASEGSATGMKKVIVQ